jgi:cell division protein FtsZ
MIPRDYVDEVINGLFEDAVDPKISVVGVGGAGGNVVSALYDRDLKGVETVAVNTDPAGLSKSEADFKVLLGHVEGEDRIAAARTSAEAYEAQLKDTLSSDIVFVVAGMGGAAGTGAAPVVARTARANGAVTIAIGIVPFDIEGRSEAAKRGLDALREEADSLIVVDNNSLNKFADQLSFNEALQVVNFMVAAIVEGVVDHLEKSFLSTVAEEVETVAKEIEEQNSHAVHMEVQPPETVQAAWNLDPVAFDDGGFIGLR